MKKEDYIMKKEVFIVEQLNKMDELLGEEAQIKTKIRSTLLKIWKIVNEDDYREVRR